MDTTLPYFPLGVLLLPGEQQYLHIFEPRYRQLLVDLESGPPQFIIPFVRDQKMERTGSLVRLSKVVERHANGTSDIIIEAEANVRILSFSKQMHQRLYGGGQAQIFHWESRELEVGEVVRNEFEQYERRSGQLNDHNSYSVEVNQLQIAQALHLSPSQKLAFLNGSQLKRDEILLNQIQHLQLLLNQEERRFNNIYLN